MSEKKQITVSAVLDALAQGKTREDIKKEYDLSHRELQTLFKHPKLKNKKTHKELSFELIDDTAEEAPAADVQPEEARTEEVIAEEVHEETIELTEQPIFSKG